MTARIPVLLLDLDGTLTDNFIGISRCVTHALRALAAAVPVDYELRACVGPPLRHSLARLLETRDPARIEEALAHYRERYATIGWSENVVYPGIAELLERQRAAGTRLYVCTAKPLVFAARIVEAFGLAAHLDGLYGASLDAALDDKALLLAHLLAREALDPRACVMVGDREHDVAAARANGVRAIGVLWGYGTSAELERAGADAIVATTAELEAALTRVFATSAAA